MCKGNTTAPELAKVLQEKNMPDAWYLLYIPLGFVWWSLDFYYP